MPSAPAATSTGFAAPNAPPPHPRSDRCGSSTAINTATCAPASTDQNSRHARPLTSRTSSGPMRERHHAARPGCRLLGSAHGLVFHHDVAVLEGTRVGELHVEAMID